MTTSREYIECFLNIQLPFVGPDESDSGGERPSSPNRDDTTSDSKDAHYRTASVPKGSDMSTQTGEDPLTKAKVSFPSFCQT